MYIQAAVTANLKLQAKQIKDLTPAQSFTVPKGTKLGVTIVHIVGMHYLMQLEGSLTIKKDGIAVKTLIKGDRYYVFAPEWIDSKLWGIIKRPLLTPAKETDLVLSAKSTMQEKPDLVPGDYHLVVLDDESKPTSSMTCYDSQGNKQWSTSCLARGQDANYSVFAGDTPPGVYYLGECWIADPGDVKTCKPYGVHCFDLVSEKLGEIGLGREGICLHGGGSALGYPGCNDDYQRLVPTFGCIRMHNGELRDTIYPLWQKTEASNNRIWVSVHQL